MTSSLPIGPVMLDVAGLTLSAEEKALIAHPNTGGVILFSRNYHDPQQVSELITDIRTSRNGDILIAVDQEGGRVQRFKNAFTQLPPAAVYANAPELAEDAGWLMAMELLAVGVDFSFAPVLDVDCGISQIIGDRAFSQDCELVTQLARQFRNGMKAAGMAATGKHFPGHGAVALDSHLTLPVDERDIEAIRNKDLLPFAQLIADGLEAVMPAHVVYSQVDTQPAGFSKLWLQDILRGQLQFDGVIFSDDLSMAGAEMAGDFPARARVAQQAGCDMMLVCNNPSAAVQVLAALPITNDAVRERRLQAMRATPTNISLDELHKTEKWQRTAKQLQQISQ